MVTSLYVWNWWRNEWIWLVREGRCLAESRHICLGSRQNVACEAEHVNVSKTTHKQLSCADQLSWMHHCTHDYNVCTNSCGDQWRQGEHVTVRMTAMTKYTQTSVVTSEGEHVTVCTTTMTKYTQTSVVTSEGEHVTVCMTTMTKYTQITGDQWRWTDHCTHDYNDKVTTVETSEGEHITVCMTTMTKYTQTTVETSEGEHITVCMTTMTKYTQITVETSEGEHITVCTTTIHTQTAVEPVKMNMSLNVRLQGTHKQLWRPVRAKYKTTKYTQTSKLQLPLKLKVGNWVMSLPAALKTRSTFSSSSFSEASTSGVASTSLPPADLQHQPNHTIHDLGCGVSCTVHHHLRCGMIYTIHHHLDVAWSTQYIPT